MTGRLRRQLVDRLPEPALRRVIRVLHHESPSLSRPVTRRAGRGVTPTVVDTFDAHAVIAEVGATVTGALDRARVPYVLLPGRCGSAREVAVAAEDRAVAVAALEAAIAAGPGWVLRQTDVVSVHRVLAAPGGRVLCGAETAWRIGFWSRADQPPGTRLAPTDNGVVEYLSAARWQEAVAAPGHWPVADPVPDVFDVREPIDIVYTWVDGSDPEWLARKDAHAPDATAASALNPSATVDSRFLSRDELRYSMRSVAMYAPWVRTIYLVTDGQVPAWLDTSHPQIAVVDHRDIFRDPATLPVFNSHAIESQLHHIDGLAEHYLYLNDDVFFGRPVCPETFFHGNGVSKFLLAPDTTIDFDPPSVRDLPAITAAKNQRAFLEAEFGVTVRRKIQHGPHPQVRGVLEEMEARYPQLFEQVSRSRFRHPDDLSIPASLQHYYAYARGRAVPGDWRYLYQDIGRQNTARRLDQILRERPQTFCLNDVDSADDQVAGQLAALRQFFDEYFPLPAPWER